MNPNNLVEEQWLTVEYALTRPEILRSFLHSVAEVPKYRVTILLYSAAIGVLTLLLRATLSQSLALKDVIIAVAYAAGFLVFIPLWTLVRGKTANRTLTVSRDGISTEIGRLSTHVPWDKVKVVADTPQFVLIGRTNGNAFFIPNRAFSGPEHRRHFLTEVRGQMQGSSQA